MPEFDAIRFGECQEPHGITVHQLDLRELDSDDTVLPYRGAKDFEVFPGNPATDVQSDTLFNPASVDSARHGRVALPDASLANRTPPATH